MNDIFYNATEIQSMVRNMDDSKRRHRDLKQTNVEEYTQKLIQENQTLHFNYPSIFSMHAQDKLDATFFYMLNQKRRVEKGEITEDQASREVGMRLYNRWVSPTVTNTAAPSEESYEAYYKRTMNK
jgi:nitrate/nitrite-specific signal transduction histidine kinase